jgi:bloom syndrome protein
VQSEVINATMKGLNVFVLMLTGGGKSLCCRITVLLKLGLTVIIS